MHTNAKDITGVRSGRIVAISPTNKRKHSCVIWEAKCDCGNRFFTTARSITGQHTKSCGCLQRETAYNMGKSNSKHGMVKTPEYNSWMCMKRRCEGKAGIYENRNYHERGIKVCKQWLGKNGFVNFLRDVGNKPSSSYTLDRINNDGDYEPYNVRWASPKQQGANRRKFGTLQNFSLQELEDEIARRKSTKANHKQK
jgi:hypothetical protein